MQSTRNPKTYLTHIPVRSHLEADILSRESTWNILKAVKAVGAQGIVADEIVASLRLPSTLVYTTLKELLRLEFISVLPREKKKIPKERKRRYVCERTTWGKYRIDSDFMSIITYEGIAKALGEKLKVPILEFFSDLFGEFGTNSRLKPYVPVSEEVRICPICYRNHEATEFVFAIILASLDPFITESKEFRELLIQKGYAI
ncbi:MAG: hypothetical protein ACREBS_09305 [Nitrososphaerales archaeon]